MWSDAPTLLYYMGLVVLYDGFCSSQTLLFSSLAFQRGLPIHSEVTLDYTRKRCLLHSRFDFFGAAFSFKERIDFCSIFGWNFTIAKRCIAWSWMARIS